MNVLIVAHPDDEILWFNPEEFDRIIIVFNGRKDKPRQGSGRLMAISEHPLKDKINCLGLPESNYWRDRTQKKMHDSNYRNLCEWLKKLQADSVTTHNANGEYGHLDHVLVHNACMATLNCPVNGKNPEIYRQAREKYKKYGCWTWY